MKRRKNIVDHRDSKLKKIILKMKNKPFENSGIFLIGRKKEKRRNKPYYLGENGARWRTFEIFLIKKLGI